MRWDEHANSATFRGCRAGRSENAGRRRAWASGGVFRIGGRIGVFRRFQDTELGISCNFVASDAGVWRCLLDTPDAVRTAELVYADPECSRPHATLYGSTVESFACAAPRYAVTPGDCEEGPQVFEVGSQVSSDVRYRLADGVCSASSSGTDYLTTLFAVTPVSLELFQAGRLDIGEETGGVVPVDARSDDGTRVRLGFRDAQEGFDCFLPDDVDDVRCAPKDAALMGYFFADSGCSQPAAMAQSCAAERGELAFAQEASPNGTSYYRTSTRLPVSYSGAPDRCQEAVNTLAFEVGAAVPMARFAAGERADVAFSPGLGAVAFSPSPRTTLGSSRTHGPPSMLASKDPVALANSRRCPAAPSATTTWRYRSLANLRAAPAAREASTSTLASSSPRAITRGGCACSATARARR